MPEENSNARLVSHILLWVIVVVIGAWLVWSATHSSTQNNKYASGSSSSDNHSTRWPLTFDFNFSCVPRELLTPRPIVQEIIPKVEVKK